MAAKEMCPEKINLLRLSLSVKRNEYNVFKACGYLLCYSLAGTLQKVLESIMCSSIQ